MSAILEMLNTWTDDGYQTFLSGLLPTLNGATILGVRTPLLRGYAKELKGTQEAARFMQELPHSYFEENQLHAFLISQMTDYSACMDALERFLPYVDNWATCDQMSPKVLKKEPVLLMENIRQWMDSDKPYTVRFAIKLLMNLYLGDYFEPFHLEMVAQITSEEYYVNMMIAWYFATALALQEEATLPYIEEHRLSKWIHGKSIQKACESHRISEEMKTYLKTLR